MSALGTLRSAASRSLLPVVAQAARAYVAGEQLSDALRVADRWGSQGLGCTLGFWDAPDDGPQRVVDECLHAIDALTTRPRGYLSLKAPSLAYRRERVEEIVRHAASAGVRVHFDAHSPETADPTQKLVESLLDAGAPLSYTLPGRWPRSLPDADWVVERQLPSRVVKGQWPDAQAPNRDLRAGFLEVIDRLAGRARHVVIASHDVPLADEAIRRLRAAGTSCNLELLFGLPMRASLAAARRQQIDVSVYVPYGKGCLPYALSKVIRDPRMWLWLARDLFARQP